MENRWTHTDAPRGDAYDDRWRTLQAEGHNVHGEADCVQGLLTRFGLSRAVLDAGCGTGRVAIELAARGIRVLGIDADPAMLDGARTKAPDLRWVLADLARWQFAPETQGDAERFGAVVLAGNVMIFVAEGSETDVLRSMAAALEPGGIVVAGFQVRADRLSLAAYDRAAEAAGLEAVARYATWDCAPYAAGDYAVSVHRLRVGVS